MHRSLSPSERKVAQLKAKVAERNARLSALLAKHAEANILDILGMFPSVTHGQFRSSTRLAAVVEVRYLIIAFLYHVCLEAELQQPVATYLRKPQNTVSKALTAVDAAARSRRDTSLKCRLQHMCGNLGLDLDRFVLCKEPNIKSKRPRPG